MQTMKHSLYEQLTRTGINWLISSFEYMFIWDSNNMKKNFLVGLFFIGQSLIVGFIIRRIYNKKESAPGVHNS